MEARSIDDRISAATAVIDSIDELVDAGQNMLRYSTLCKDKNERAVRLLQQIIIEIDRISGIEVSLIDDDRYAEGKNRSTLTLENEFDDDFDD